MGLSASEQLGRVIGGLVKGQEQIHEDHVPGDVSQSLILSPLSRGGLSTSIVTRLHYIASSSFVLDHPVYGELDSSSLHLDGGYSSTITL